MQSQHQWRLHVRFGWVDCEHQKGLHHEQQGYEEGWRGERGEESYVEGEADKRVRWRGSKDRETQRND